MPRTSRVIQRRFSLEIAVDADSQPEARAKSSRGSFRPFTFA